ncbi:MAG: DinB family protein [Chitinophagales bacterium]
MNKSKWKFNQLLLLFGWLGLFTLCTSTGIVKQTKENTKSATTPTPSLSAENNASNMEMTATDSLPPYYQIPDAPETYSNVNVAARMIDGLGYRYYWATEGLTETDLDYRPSEDSRTARETLDHLYGLSMMIVNAPLQQPNIRPLTGLEDKSFEEKRVGTLNNFKQASDVLRASSPADMEAFKIVFQRGERVSEFPFWNMLNGPIADAIYHTGQIVAYRRASGNPVNSGMNVFMGKTREQ